MGRTRGVTCSGVSLLLVHWPHISSSEQHVCRHTLCLSLGQLLVTSQMFVLAGGTPCDVITVSLHVLSNSYLSSTFCTRTVIDKQTRPPLSGHTGAHAVSRRPLTPQATVRCKVGACGICGGPSGTVSLHQCCLLIHSISANDNIAT